jgi:endogenous inhibitor of DNA gyrase (YacG/DUF329 family)
MPGRVFSNHVRWCEFNPTRNQTQRLAEATRDWFDREKGPVKSFKVNCYKCGKEFEIQEREKNFPTKEAYYCSRACANTRRHSEATKQKINEAFDRNGLRKQRIEKTCLYCGILFKDKKESRQFCSKKCSAQSRRSSEGYKRYRADCKFKFNIYNYPDKFDLGLIEEHGWYKAFNRGNNLSGISRDHCVSIRYGWDNGIPAELISHPANCVLLRHTENQKKNRYCSITIDELYVRITEWDKSKQGNEG